MDLILPAPGGDRKKEKKKGKKKKEKSVGARGILCEEGRKKYGNKKKGGRETSLTHRRKEGCWREKKRRGKGGKGKKKKQERGKGESLDPPSAVRTILVTAILSRKGRPWNRGRKKEGKKGGEEGRKNGRPISVRILTTPLNSSKRRREGERGKGKWKEKRE